MSATRNRIQEFTDVDSQAYAQIGQQAQGKAVCIAERFKTKMCRNWTLTQACPYEQRCMFAHGDAELRTKDMNLRDELTTDEAVKQFQRRVYYHRQAQQQLQAANTASTPSACDAPVVAYQPQHRPSRAAVALPQETVLGAGCRYTHDPYSVPILPEDMVTMGEGAVHDAVGCPFVPADSYAATAYGLPPPTFQSQQELLCMMQRDMAARGIPFTGATVAADQYPPASPPHDAFAPRYGTPGSLQYAPPPPPPVAAKTMSSPARCGGLPGLSVTVVMPALAEKFTPLTSAPKVGVEAP